MAEPSAVPQPAAEALATRVVAVLQERGETLATAESLTAGLIAATVARVPGASAVLRGGLITYSNDLKHELAGVDPGVLSHDGAVSRRAAEQLAQGARLRCHADLGVSATGIAGPTGQEGKPVGTVWISLADVDGVTAHEFHLSGDREQIRTGTVTAAFRLLLAKRGMPQGGSAL